MKIKKKDKVAFIKYKLNDFCEEYFLK